MTQVWFISGSTGGLGRALAEAVLAAGHSLLATARNPAPLADLAERYGDRVRTLAMDVTDETAVRAAIECAVDTFGRLDVVVNNAGYGNLAAIEETTSEDFRAQVETNLFGVVNVTRAALPSCAASVRVTSSRFPPSEAVSAPWDRAPTPRPSGASKASRKCSRRKPARWASR